MLDYKGILTNITGFAKTSFYVTLRRGSRNSTNTSVTSTSSASSSKQTEHERLSRDRELVRRHGRLSSSEEARNTAVMGREAREDGIYTEENGAGSPFVVVVSCYNLGEMVVEKSVELENKKMEEGQIPKKKRSRELNIPQRNMFAPDFVIRPDEDLPGFSPIDSEYDTDDDAFEAEELNHRKAPRHTQSMPPPLSGMNPDIPNEYDPVIGIIAIQGVRIPRSRPIDIVPNREPLFPFFGVNSDLQVMLITERMYDVFKERIHSKGKERMLTMMENLAMTLTCGQMCGRLVPVEMMDQTVYYYDYDTVSFLSREELINLLMLCEPDQIEDIMVASSFPSKFHRETPEQMLQRNKHYQHLMHRPQIFLRRTDYMSCSIDDEDFTFPYFESVDNEHNKRLTLERQLNDDNVDHEEMGALIRTISQDLEEAERQNGLEFVHRSTLALYDARVIIPPVN
ncbi:uncharacterized protein CELE_W03G11.4 [Caenorhabditis elegans]|uniref:Uncharacterized protein n=1 Tax=Caenorhabditis elegans TaxID=6239 RepID=G5EFR7_CAEEL|nr:Uncharacterized protein CELE_W03G11.4 [Caenorhabditis elegans]CAA91547.2 Uncharacterized protein CELE_W03G11.4 [Caenorhabditis elegans]